MRLWTLLQGKKTYISAAALAGMAVYFFLFGNDPSTAMFLLTMALSVVGIRDHQERKAQAILSALSDIRMVVGDLQNRNNAAVTSDVVKVISDAEAAIAK